MNKVMKYILALVSVMLCLGVTACYDDEFDFVGDGNMCVTVSATAKFTDEESRAILNESGGKNIGVYTLLVFSSSSNNATLIHAEDLGNNLNTSIKTVYLPSTSGFVSGNEEYYAVLLGNVALSQLNLSVNNSTLNDLYSAAYSATASDNNPTDASKFTWSAYLNISKSTSSLNFNLKPNVAKVKVRITNNSQSEEIKLVNIRVRNVMNKVRYAQNALTAAGKFTVDDNTKGSPSPIDYNKESINLSKNESAEITWYVPANMCGTGKRTNGNVTLPAGTNPTYVEVLGVRSVDHLSTAYKIYLGTGASDYNVMTDFNVKADNLYNINASITNDGLTFNVYNTPDKTNGTAAGVVKLPSNTNCHMINPNFSKTASGYPIYELPIDRINECWGSGGLIPDGSMDLLEGESWTMDVIWQDINARVIQFCDKNGNNVSDTYSGTGVTPAYFKICPSPVTSSHYGNILVGVKKTGSSDYLWSWHLWVTDYNPDVAAPYSSGTYIRESTGTTGINGSVQHWHHIHDVYWGTSKFLSGAIWEGLYKNSWIMDRNLGAVALKPWLNTTKTYGCYYQWGNKTPYPHATHKHKTTSSTPTTNNAAKGKNELKKLYKIDGSTETAFILDEYNPVAKTVKEVVKAPNVFYGTSGDQLYADSYTGKNNIWASPNSITTRKKSIFDPCPIGWTVPVYDIMDFLTVSPGSYDLKDSSGNKGAPDEISGWLGRYTVTSSSDFLGAVYCTLTVNRENEDATVYGQKDFARAILSYTSSGTNKAYAADFPIQGVLSADDNGISSNEKSYFWFSEPSIISGQENQGDVCAIFSYRGSDSTVSRFTGITYREKKGKDITQYLQELSTIAVVYYDEVGFNDVWSGRMSRLSLIKSRGQNVRCIQLPDKETPKYYNK